MSSSEELDDRVTLVDDEEEEVEDAAEHEAHYPENAGCSGDSELASTLPSKDHEETTSEPYSSSRTMEVGADDTSGSDVIGSLEASDPSATSLWVHPRDTPNYG